MRKAIAATFLMAAASSTPLFAAGVTVGSLTVEHLTDPQGIGNTTPRFSWKLDAQRNGVKQTAYEIVATPIQTGPATVTLPPLWSSGKVASDQSVLVPWAGQPLASRANVEWKVRVWDDKGDASEWSTPAHFELGLLDAATEWKGQWITAELPRVDLMAAPLAKASWIGGGSTAQQGTGVRYVLELPADAKVLSATLDANADGLLSLYVNGTATKEGPSSHTAPFHADYVNQLKPGKNTIAVYSLAVRRPTGQDKRNAIAAHGSVDLADGRHIEFNTNGDWKAAVAPTGNWFAPDFDDSAWTAASVLGAYDPKELPASADSTLGPGRYLRKTFTVKGPVAKARLYSTALGTYEASINGKPINDHVLDPGWTEYTKRVMVQTTDVTALLKPGENVVGTLLSDGWFAGRVGWAGLAQYSQISRRPLFNAQLEITYADGTTEVIASDASWKGGAGEVVGSDQQIGEIIDSGQPAEGAVTTAGFDDSKWTAAVVTPNIAVPLVPQVGPPVRKLMELAPQKITRYGDTFVVDLGQNMVGHVRLTAKGPAGTRITLSHGEMLADGGLIYNENLRQAISLDTFVLKGDPTPETFEPHFTFHGFRYVQITGYPGDLKPEDIKGVVIGSDNPPTGAFETSDKDVNRLYENIVWGQRSNFISVPTDCPQRDERMGWMGDAQVFSPTASHNADVAAFFTKWIIDVNDGQSPGGAFNNVNPKARENQSYAVWGDAGVVIPWVMYTTYGDQAFLSDNYDHMARWVDYTQKQFPALLVTGGVGDHLAPVGRGPGAGARGAAAGGFGGPRGRGAGAGAPAAPGSLGSNTTMVVDTAYFAHSAWIVARAAEKLGKTDDAKKYDALFHQVADAFDQNFVQPDGTIGTQTTYVLALKFDLLPENIRAAAAKHLADDVAAKEHLTTGFVGVGYINPVLTQIGRSDLAYQLLFQDTYPSWLFEVKQGATTMWERWDGYTPESGFQASSMNSFNHYSFGAVGRWLYSGPLGINLDESHPGFKEFVLAPQFSGKLQYAKGKLETVYGTINSGWHVEGDKVLYDVTVPPNSAAVINLPEGAEEGGKPVKAGTKLESGTYHFSVPKGAVK